MSQPEEAKKRPVLGAWQQVLMSKIKNEAEGSSEPPKKKEVPAALLESLQDSGLSDSEDEDSDLEGLEEGDVILGSSGPQDTLDIPQFVCALCPKTFSINSLLNLDTHIAEAHKDDTFCSICKQTFKSMLLVKKHEPTCSDAQPFCKSMEFVECFFCKHLYRSDKLRDHISAQHSKQLTPKLMAQLEAEKREINGADSNKPEDQAVKLDPECEDLPPETKTSVDVQSDQQPVAVIIKEEPKNPAFKLNLPNIKRKLQISLNKEDSDETDSKLVKTEVE